MDSPKVINGKLIAAQIKQEILSLSSACTCFRKPKLVILYIGYNAASELYIKYKRKFAHECKIQTELFYFDKHVKFDSLKKVIQDLNNDETVDGIMIQLPLPKSSTLDLKQVLNLINPNKDVDGLTSYTLGQAWNYQETYPFTSCTAHACMKILKHQNYSLNGKKALVIGSTIVIGQPVTAMLSSQKATVTIANSQTKNLSEWIKNSDLIISATGQKNLIQNSMLNKNTVIIDVGTNKDERGKTHGDVETSSVLENVQWISPSPGGVGPVTVACLCLHTMQAYLRHINKE